MQYVLHIPNGSVWTIEESEPSHRWTLSHRTDQRQRRAGSYNSPSAAALAVAANETGIDEWDIGTHPPVPFNLSVWERVESAIN